METHWKVLIGIGILGGAVLTAKAFVKSVKVPEIFKETIEWRNLSGRIINDKVIYDIPISPDLEGRTSGSRIYIPENAQSIGINKDPSIYKYVFEYNASGELTEYTSYYDGAWYGTLTTYKPNKVYAIHANQRIRLEIPLMV